MNRRSFLKLGAAAAVGVAAVRAGILPTKAAEAFNSYAQPPHGMMWQGIPMRVDIDCPEDRIYFVATSRVQPNLTILPQDAKLFGMVRL
jgi:hypothetical protein